MIKEFKQWFQKEVDKIKNADSYHGTYRNQLVLA